MNKPLAHNVLRKSESDEVIVCADFSAAGRPSATFTDFADLLTTEHNVWETGLPPWGQEVGMSGADQADRWAGDLQASGATIRAVLGYCAGTIYAAAIAERVARWQEFPVLILLDPELPDRSTMLDDYERMISRRLAPVLSPATVRTALADGREVYDRETGAMDLADGLAVLCHKYMQPALLGTGLGSGHSAELPQLMASYLIWQAGCTEIDPRAAWAKGTAVNSTSNPDIPTFNPAEHAPLMAGVINFPISHSELLRDTDVARAVDELVK